LISEIELRLYLSLDEIFLGWTSEPLGHSDGVEDVSYEVTDMHVAGLNDDDKDDRDDK
jgi:hypothetical protein